MEIPKKLQDEIWDYCRLNDITDLDGFIVKSLKSGFNIVKFGNSPFDIEPEVVEKIVEKEVIKEVVVEKIVEKRIEVPVEKIVEKEVIKEVPVEKVIEKEVYVTDNEAVNSLQVELDRKQTSLDNSMRQWGEEVSTLKEKLEVTQKDESVHKKAVYLIAKEKKELKDKLDEVRRKLDDTTKDDQITELNNKLVDETNNHIKTKEEVTKLQKQIDTISKGGKGDFYGEGGNKKGGWWK